VHALINFVQAHRLMLDFAGVRGAGTMYLALLYLPRPRA
jgi:NhaP-type Na+/H+ or K+/H+ antiporter